jgi:endonuclease-3
LLARSAPQLVTERLAALHGLPSARRRLGPQVGCEERRSVLDSLVRTLLSQNTTDATSSRAFATLKQRFPSWDSVRDAPLMDVADAIRVRCCGGKP